MTNRCPVCGSSRTDCLRESVKGGKVKKGAAIRVLSCGACDLVFLETWDDPERVYSFYAEDQYVFAPDHYQGPPPKFNDYELYLQEVEPFLRPDASILDIGCGDGTFLRAVKDRVGKVQGLEITQAQQERLRRAGIPVWDKPLQECRPEEPFDIVIMHALLEHIPLIGNFLEDLKRFIRPGSMMFIAVPHGLDPIASFYDVPAYRDFFFREYHLYYFTETSLRKLMASAGFECVFSPLQAASIANHFHWIHRGRGQSGSADYTSVKLPSPLLREVTPSGRRFADILDEVDDFYRLKLQEAGVGDLLHCRAWLPGSPAEKRN